VRWRLPASIALVVLTGCASQSSVAAPPQSPGDGPGAAAAPPARRPELGEYVPVDQQAEPLVQLEPMYPDEAKRAGIEGTILVQALVIEDGGVAECRAVPSIPALEDAAVDCVRQWRFKPAMKDGKPVAVWVTVPVRFMLH
jgi:periplasmic protein TonB